MTLCSIKFSVCGPLPADSCGFETSAGFCQNIEHSGGLVKQHETGKQTLILNEASEYIAYSFHAFISKVLFTSWMQYAFTDFVSF